MSSLEKVHVDTPQGTIEGSCDPRFRSLVDVFQTNLAERGEIGAGVCVTVEGEIVADLWGGFAVPKKGNQEEKPWTEDTVTTVFSSTKGALAFCAHILADRGIIDLDAPVTEYWPEFGQKGKEGARVSMMLDHTAGVPALREPVPQDHAYDFDYMAERIADEEAFWEPGTRQGYHGLTYAWTIGTVIRKALGKPAGQFFAEEVAGPLGLDFHIGVSAEAADDVEARFAPISAPTLDKSRPPSDFTVALLNDPQAIPTLFFLNNGGINFNSRECHAAEIGSANGVTNGRGLAKMYAPLSLGGAINGKTFVGEETLTRMGRVAAATELDATLLIPTRFALGFMKSMDNRILDTDKKSVESALLSDAAFGHVGAGGSIGFADPDARMSFGYVMNKQGLGILLNERGQSLIDATYQALGYRHNKGGVWIR